MGNFPKLPEGAALQVGKHKATVVKYLSEGGFAHIYKVTIDPPEYDSNIACLKRVIVPDKNGLNELRKEVDVMKTLRHGRNIVKYYDSHAERLDNGTYQVLVLMELCPNGSLLDFMNKHIKTKLNEPQILKIMLDICQGIYEMHKLKLIHRDIKIENVLIDSRDGFQLCDFGSTAIPTMPPQDQNQFNYLSHDILYHTTPQYRSPEMVDLYRGLPIDEKADIWALGCFLYKLCYYTTPFEANGDIAILHASFQFPPLPEFSGDLKNLIIIMLQENPLFRPNIVQVLILKLKLKDFYNSGPYNFQALHEYQVHKQNELLRQKQMYYQQQALANSQNVLPDEQGIAVPVPGKPAVPAVPPAGATPPPPPSQVQPPQVPPEVQARAKPQPKPPVQVQEPTIEDGIKKVVSPTFSMSPEVKASSLQIPTALTSGSSRESLAGFSSDDDLANDIAEIERLEDAEQRYPSLDDIEVPEVVSQKSAAPSRSTSIKTSRSDAVSAKSVEKEQADLWSKTSKVEAEKLADDIFSSAISPVVPTAEKFETKVDGDAKVINDYDLAKSVDNLNIGNNEPSHKANRNPFPYARSTNLAHSESNFEHQPKKKTNPWGNYANEESVPFTPSMVPQPGKEQQPQSKPQSQSQPPQAQPPPQPQPPQIPQHPQIPQQSPQTRPQSFVPQSSHPFAYLDISDKQFPSPEQMAISDSNNPDLKVSLENSKLVLPEPNLIDLEVGLESSGTSPSLSNSRLGNDSEVSLIDMDESKMNNSDKKTQEPKPAFKKRVSSANHNPSQLSLQEEVIDFASDDENPDNGSGMNRLKIRSSLRRPVKGRRSGEHKRSESYSTDTSKKRLSFFGGN
ncbi:PRK1 Actin-regulating kinase PRK1 [Candida maltosa Xu316]